jgi:hypothetical protein
MESLQNPRSPPRSADLMQAGDYCYIEKHTLIRKFEPVAKEAPRGFIRKMIRLFLERIS